MKKIVSLILLISPLLFQSSCKDSNGLLVKFDMDYTAYVTIKSGNILNVPFDVFTPDITTNSEAEFESNDTRKEKVHDIKLKSMDMKITSPNGKTFSFLKHIYFYINANGLDERRFAYKENIESQDSEIVLTAEDVDLAAFIKKDKFSLRVEAVQRETINQDVDITSNMVFTVRADAL